MWVRSNLNGSGKLRMSERVLYVFNHVYTHW